MCRHANVFARGSIRAMVSVVFNTQTKEEELKISQFSQQHEEFVTITLPFGSRETLISKLQELDPGDDKEF